MPPSNRATTRAANRRHRRATKTRTCGPCGWSIELVAYGASVAAHLDHDLNDLPVEVARFCLGGVLGEFVVAGAHRGLWDLPREWAGAAPSPPGLTWASFEVDGLSYARVRIFKGTVVFTGKPEVANQLALAIANALRDCTATPTKSWETGGYDHSNLILMAPGLGGEA